MVADIMEFFKYTTAYDQPSKVKTPASALYYALHVMKHNTLLSTTVNGSGAVTYYPRLKDSTVDKPRTTSLTRLVRYLSQTVPALSLHDWQPLQDEIIKWASMELGNDYWTFEEVIGDDLIEAYRTGPHSCMRGRRAQLQLYATNPEKVSLLKVYQAGNYAGRALIWTADNGQRLLDRVYPGNGTLAFAARRHAKANGWEHKEYDGLGYDVKLPGFEVTLKHPSNRRIPYLDTVRYVSECDDNHITLTPNCTYGNGNFSNVGGYTGFATAVYPGIRYVDGGLVVSQYAKSEYVGYWRFTPPELIKAYFYGRGGRRVELALRPTDTVYRLPDEQAYRTQDAVVKIGDTYYRRKDVRKRRGIDAYTAKADAVGMTAIEIIKFSNGANAVILGVA